MIALGWIGVFKPQFAFTTPMELLLPDVITSDDGAHAILHSHATEFNPRSLNPYYRTAAPYPYTNNWGTGFAILVPCVVAYLTSVRTGWLRTVLLVTAPLALVPAFFTLNRGMFIGLGAGLLYLGVRALMRGDVRLIGSIVGVAIVGWIATLFIPVTDLISNRVENTDSTSDRADLYVQTMAAVVKSPLLGYGAPRLVDTTHGAEPLGTQGQMWMMMYSHGIPALLLFLALLRRRGVAAGRSRDADRQMAQCGPGHRPGHHPVLRLLRSQSDDHVLRVRVGDGGDRRAGESAGCRSAGPGFGA